MVDNEICLLKIFTYLPLKSLNSCSSVCKIWNKLTSEVKIKRKSSVKTIYCSADNDEDLDGFRRNLRSEIDLFMAPSELSIMFLTNSSQAAQKLSRASKRSRNENATLRPSSILKGLLPPSSKESIFIYSSGIVGTDYKNRKTFEVESLNDEIGMSGLFLPKSDEYRVHALKFSNQLKFPDFKKIDDFNRFFNVNEDLMEEIKYCLVLAGSTSKHKLNEFFKFLNRNLKNEVALSGGYVQKFEFENEVDKRANLLVLSFISKKDVLNVSQVLIPHADEMENRKELINKKLTELRNDVLKFKNKAKFAIQIICCSRGIGYYDKEESYESKLFKKFFPEVPLVGFFGYGELGIDFLSNLDENERDNDDINWIGFSTVFTVLSF